MSRATSLIIWETKFQKGLVSNIVSLSYCLILSPFQHPFIQTATDPKPILDLLAEYKAEIVEEEILDIPEDKMVSQIY